MQANNIIAPVDRPTPWVNSIVCVEKRDGSLRVCLDPRDLNKAILREHYAMPTRDELLSRLNGAKYFTTLDASSSFWQCKLDEESSFLTTFNIPFGRFRFLVLPFGICSAPEVFHKTVRRIFEHFPGVETSMDDILVYGKTRKEHDERVRQVLQACRDANLKLNRSKCEFGKTSVLYMGDIISSEGLHPDPKKVIAISNMTTPSCKHDVQRFLGMINYLARFVPNLPNYTDPLRELLHKKQEWAWNEKHNTAFQNLKKLISQAPVLKFCDPKKPIKISSDASKNGFGAVLLQQYGSEYFPVAYAARSMTVAEQRYAMIEKELLGIVFACEKFHQYIYGATNVIVENDHKPLSALFNKSLSSCPLRVQRFMLRLQMYHFTFSFTPGKFLNTADTLSRSNPGVENNNQRTTYIDEIETATNNEMLSLLPVSDRATKQILE